MSMGLPYIPTRAITILVTYYILKGPPTQISAPPQMCSVFNNPLSLYIDCVHPVDKHRVCLHRHHCMINTSILLYRGKGDRVYS